MDFYLNSVILQNLDNFNPYNGSNFTAHIIRNSKITIIEGIDTGGLSPREIIFPNNYSVLYVQLTPYGQLSTENNKDIYYSPCLGSEIPRGSNKFLIVPRYWSSATGSSTGYYAEPTFFRAICKIN